MTTADFRLGNFIQDPAMTEKSIVSHIVVNTITSNQINGSNISLITPLNITEDWLIKLGFMKLSDVTATEPNGGFTKDDLFLQLDGNMKFIATLWKIEGRNDGNSFTRIKAVLFIHELQNLYYAISGKELVLIS